MSVSLSFEDHPYFVVAKEVLASHSCPVIEVRSCWVDGEIFVRIFVNCPIDRVVDLNFEFADTLAAFEGVMEEFSIMFFPVS